MTKISTCSVYKSKLEQSSSEEDEAAVQEDGINLQQPSF